MSYRAGSRSMSRSLRITSIGSAPMLISPAGWPGPWLISQTTIVQRIRNEPGSCLPKRSAGASSISHCGPALLKRTNVSQRTHGPQKPETAWAAGRTSSGHILYLNWTSYRETLPPH